MNDPDLARYLNLTPAEFGKLQPEYRERMRALADKGVEIELHLEGLAPRPSGVILCAPKRGGRGHRCR